MHLKLNLFYLISMCLSHVFLQVVAMNIYHLALIMNYFYASLKAQKTLIKILKVSKNRKEQKESRRY